jgi:hypothetical protein
LTGGPDGFDPSITRFAPDPLGVSALPSRQEATPLT